MKFQTKHIAKFILIAAVSLSVAGIVGAETSDPTPTDPGTTSSTPTDPSPTSPTNPTPSDPCANSFSVTNPSTSCINPPPSSPCPTAFSVTNPASACIPPAPVVPVVPPVEPVNYEENVTFNDTDLGVALFKSTDAEGNPTMDFYRLTTGTTNSTFLFSVTQTDIAPYMTDHPAVNTLIASADGVEVYVLTTGEIQVNAGPDAEGKIHVKIFNGIPWTQVYGYTIDPVK